MSTPSERGTPSGSWVCHVREVGEPAALDALDAGLDAFNRAEPALHEVRPLSVCAVDTDGSLRGGALGRTWGGCAELQQLWVRAADRGCGGGSRLLALFEEAAAQRGCTLVYLESFSFQAPAFYEKNGYRTVLAVRGFPEGIAKFTLHKRLGPSPIAAATPGESGTA